ncbi:MAG: hypothetical protein NVSMB56_18970 [Pyrinomonadaceae bacterium]
MDNLVLSNIAHRPARTIVSVMGIGVGVLLIVFTVGLAHGQLEDRARREANVHAEIMLRPSGSLGLSGGDSFTIPVAQAGEISRIEGVRAAVPVGQTTIASDTGFGVRPIEGIDFASYSALTGMRVVEGRALNETGDDIISSTEWMNQNKAKLGDTLKLYERDFHIVGVYEPPGGFHFKVPLRTLQEQLGSEGRCNAILVACVNPAEQDAVAERIGKQFPNSQIIFTRDLPELYVASIPALNVFLKTVVGIAAGISTLVILLAMYTTVTERTRQIGILKALGMSNARIAWVIEQEALLVSFLGAVFGFILTIVARFVVMRFTTLNIQIEPRWLLIALLIGLCGGTIGALYPALRAARQDAVEALSYE